jgi:hypothetical protein
MNVQIDDRSTNDRIDRVERYQDGTITTTGWTDASGYFNVTVVTQLHNGYRSQEQVTGYAYADGTMVNVQRRMISEQQSYAHQQSSNYRSMDEYRSYDAPQRHYAPQQSNHRTLDTYQAYEAYESNWRPATR